MAQRLVVEFSMRGAEEQRGDRYAIRSEVLGFTVYGANLREARKAFSEALTVLIRSFGSDVYRLRDYLDQMGVHHRLVRETVPPELVGDDRIPQVEVTPIEKEEPLDDSNEDGVFEQRYGVPIGAA